MPNRSERIQQPSISLQLRSPEGDIETFEAFREDVLEWQPDPTGPSSFFLLLDFGIEQRFAMVLPRGPDGRPMPPAEGVWQDTGRIQLDLQHLDIDRIDDWDGPDTAHGAAQRIQRYCDTPVDLYDDDHPATAHDAPEQPQPRHLDRQPMVGYRLHPVSSRRG